MQINKKEFTATIAKDRKQVQITIDQDCNVPDTKADMEKMIQTKGHVVIQETELMVDRIRLKGDFFFQGLYGTSDARTYLEALEFTLPFEEYIHMAGAIPTDDVKITYAIDDMNTVRINSRKLSIRILLTFTISLSEEIKEEGIVEMEEENLSVLKKESQVTDVVVNKKDIARIKEELVLPTNKANIYQLLWDQINLEDVQGKLDNHRIEIRGDMHIFVLYIGEDDQVPVQYARWTIPIETQVECEECEPGMIGKIQVELGSEELIVRPDLDGEERMIEVDGVLDCQIKIYEDKTISYVADAYTMNRELTPSFHSVTFETLVGKNQATMKLEDQFHLEQEGGKILQVLSVQGTCNVDDQEVKESGIEVEGVVMANVLFLTTDDNTPIVSDTYILPFTYLIETKNMKPEDEYQLDVHLDKISGLPSQGSQIEIKAGVIFDLIIFHKKEEDIMVDITEAPLDYGKMQELPGIVAYWVKDGDTLWSIAKKYYTTVERIQEENQIEEVKQGDKLILVKEMR